MGSINLKDKVLEVLKFSGHTFAQLSEHLDIPEIELDQQFATNSLEVRTLELMSKVLRIPLYSLFRDSEHVFSATEEPYYNVDIWGKDGVRLRTTLKKDSDGNISDKELEKLKKELKGNQKK